MMIRLDGDFITYSRTDRPDVWCSPFEFPEESYTCPVPVLHFPDAKYRFWLLLNRPYFLPILDSTSV